MKPLLFLLLATGLSHAAITYATPGDDYEQKFDTLATTGSTNAWANDSTVTGWYWWSSSIAANVNTPTGTPTTYTASATTTATQGQVLSLGKRSDLPDYIGEITDRAFGGQGTTSNTLNYGMQILNTTGITLTSFSLAYQGEQWRTINGESRDKLTLEYAVFPVSPDPMNPINRLGVASSAGWTAIPSLQFDAPVANNSGSTGIDGNVNSVDLSGTSTLPLNWTNGTELWIRWRDNGSPQSAMGVDDIVFSAVPEPSALLLSALGLLPLLRRKR